MDDKRAWTLGSGLMAWLSSLEARQLVVVLIVVAAFSFSIVYTSVQTYDPVLTPASGYVDTRVYIAVYRGEAPSSHGAYRVLTPWLARWMPDVPTGLFHKGRPFTLDYAAAWRFGLVNFGFLTLAGVVLYVFQRGLSLTFVQSLAGAVLFFSSTAVTRSGGLPMTEAGLWFFLILGFVAIQRDMPWLLALTSALGALNNENVLLLVPVTLLKPRPWRERIRLLIGVLPGFFVFFALRRLIDVPGGDFLTSGQILAHLLPSARRFLGPNAYVGIVLAFGPLWLPAVYAWIRCPLPTFLRRCLWFIPLVVAAILVGTANIQRSLFLIFPIVLPSAVLGFSDWLSGAYQLRPRQE